jgi:hypothetical protein
MRISEKLENIKDAGGKSVALVVINHNLRVGADSRLSKEALSPIRRYWEPVTVRVQVIDFEGGKVHRSGQMPKLILFSRASIQNTQLRAWKRLRELLRVNQEL